MRSRPAAFVLDAFSLIAYWDKEPSGQAVEEVLARAHDNAIPLLISVVNFGEVYYIITREISERDAEKALAAVYALGVEMVPVDWELTRQAARYKARGRISYADSFALALAKLRNGELVTGDPEFKAFDKDVRIAWI